MKNSYFNVASIFILSSLSLIAMEQPLNVTDIKQPQTIDDIPEFCVSLAKKLDDQPWDNSKQIPRKSLLFNYAAGRTDAYICYYMDAQASIQHNNKLWNIQLLTSKDSKQPGITYENSDITIRPSFDELHNHYLNIIRKIKDKWQFDKISKYKGVDPEVLSDDNYYLLTKENAHSEPLLILHLIEKFNLHYQFHSDIQTSFLCPKESLSIVSGILVKKSAFKQFKAIFKLEVDAPKD
jgi:hypothetical protein